MVDYFVVDNVVYLKKFYDRDQATGKIQSVKSDVVDVTKGMSELEREIHNLHFRPNGLLKINFGGK